MSLRPDAQDRLKVETAFKFFKWAGYDAVGLGETDFIHGLELLRTLSRQYPFLICANLLNEKGQPIFRPVTYKQIPGRGGRKPLRVAITSFFSLTLGEEARRTTGPEGQKLQVVDPVKLANEMIPRLRKQADLLIVLAHMPLVEAGNFVKQVPGMDVVVVTHSPMSGIWEPVAINGTYLVANGDRGRFAGELGILLDSYNRLSGVKGQLVPLTNRFKDDPDISALMEEYKKQVAALPPPSLVVTSNSKDGNGFIGAEKCAPCHVTEFVKWEESKHHHALETLKQKDNGLDAFNPECLKCHVLGYGQAGGYLSETRTPELAGVQCEHCHGPGKLHAAAAWQKKPSKNLIERGKGSAVCLKCHTPENSPKFNYQEYLEKIRHW